MTVIKQRPEIEVRWNDDMAWEKLYSRVKDICIEFAIPALDCGKPTDEYCIREPEKGVHIEYGYGGEDDVYDIRINGGKSAREEWEGDCNGPERD